MGANLAGERKGAVGKRALECCSPEMVSSCQPSHWWSAARGAPTLGTHQNIDIALGNVGKQLCSLHLCPLDEGRE